MPAPWSLQGECGMEHGVLSGHWLCVWEGHGQEQRTPTYLGVCSAEQATVADTLTPTGVCHF